MGGPDLMRWTLFKRILKVEDGRSQGGQSPSKCTVGFEETNHQVMEGPRGKEWGQLLIAEGLSSPATRNWILPTTRELGRRSWAPDDIAAPGNSLTSFEETLRGPSSQVIRLRLPGTREMITLWCFII